MSYDYPEGEVGMRYRLLGFSTKFMTTLYRVYIGMGCGTRCWVFIGMSL
jgi:hypothetical protein